MTAVGTSLVLRVNWAGGVSQPCTRAPRATSCQTLIRYPETQQSRTFSSRKRGEFWWIRRCICRSWSAENTMRQNLFGFRSCLLLFLVIIFTLENDPENGFGNCSRVSEDVPKCVSDIFGKVEHSRPRNEFKSANQPGGRNGKGKMIWFVHTREKRPFKNFRKDREIKNCGETKSFCLLSALTPALSAFSTLSSPRPSLLYPRRIGKKIRR